MLDVGNGVLDDLAAADAVSDVVDVSVVLDDLGVRVDDADALVDGVGVNYLYTVFK